MSDRDTKDRILDAAEELFAEHGFASTSLRHITTLAGVNLASVNYHFGSKDALIRAAVARRAAPINQERLELLDRALTEAGTKPPRLESLIDAFISPPIRLFKDPRHGPTMMRLMGKLHTDSYPGLDTLMLDVFGPFARRFLEAFERALPGIDRRALAWRVLFMLGTMSITLADREKLRFFSLGKASPDDLETARTQMIAFLAAGLRAHVTGKAPAR